MTELKELDRKEVILDGKRVEVRLVEWGNGLKVYAKLISEKVKIDKESIEKLAKQTLTKEKLAALKEILEEMPEEDYIYSEPEQKKKSVPEKKPKPVKIQVPEVQPKPEPKPTIKELVERKSDILKNYDPEMLKHIKKNARYLNHRRLLSEITKMFGVNLTNQELKTIKRELHVKLESGHPETGLDPEEAFEGEDELC